jgi:hypothetical protein
VCSLCLFGDITLRCTSGNITFLWARNIHIAQGMEMVHIWSIRTWPGWQWPSWLIYLPSNTRIYLLNPKHFHSFQSSVYIFMVATPHSVVTVLRLLGLPTWPYEGCRHRGTGNRVVSAIYSSQSILGAQSECMNYSFGRRCCHLEWG